MNDDKIKELQRKWFNLISDSTLIECGDGWFDLIDLLCRAINSETTARANYGVEIVVKIDTIKQKFGGLRVYYDVEVSSKTHDNAYQDPAVIRGLGYIEGAVHMAELYSYHVCENCGNRGECDPKANYFRTECMACYTMNRDAQDDQYGI